MKNSLLVRIIKRLGKVRLLFSLEFIGIGNPGIDLIACCEKIPLPYVF
jgi:hypothetical protein